MWLGLKTKMAVSHIENWLNYRPSHEAGPGVLEGGLELSQKQTPKKVP